MLDFNFRRVLNHEVASDKIVETLKNSGYDADFSGNEVSVKGLKNFWCNAQATVRTENNLLKVEGKVTPAPACLVMTGIAAVLVLVFLFTPMEEVDDLLAVMVAGILGVSGLFSCLISFFTSKKFLTDELAQVISFIQFTK